MLPSALLYWGYGGKVGMGQFGMGQPVRRLEDQRFLTGQGQFLADIPMSGLVHGYVLRSPHAHAVIRRIDHAAARAAPGVLAVFTCAYHEAEGLGPIPCGQEIQQKDGSRQVEPPRHALARDRVRHVGDPLAFVVAETADQARDAVELIAVDYETLPTVLDTGTADHPRQTWGWRGWSPSS